MPAICTYNRYYINIQYNMHLNFELVFSFCIFGFNSTKYILDKISLTNQ